MDDAVGVAHQMTSARSDRNATTRERILDAAERLYAEHGVHAVSNRAVAEAAGQGNNAVVGYHFGTKADLVQALIRRRATEVDRIRDRMVRQVGPDADLRDWVDCLVWPVAEHLEALGSPTWYARSAAQLATDPALRALMVRESENSPSLNTLLEGMNACLPRLPDEVRVERGDMCQLLIVHYFAERERALAEADSGPRRSWSDAARALSDAIIGIWLAPVSSTVPPGTTVQSGSGVP